nr:antirestriction protein [uncultured Hyphomonas sp.]
METSIITKTRVQEAERLGFLPRQAGADYLRFESLVFHIMDKASPDYSGGYWDFYSLSNGGFFIAPASDDRFAIHWDLNYFEGEMSAEAAGIAVCLLVLGNLSFESTNPQHMAEKFYALREFAADHAEASAIFGFID